jgi:hypothetical protein
VPPSPGARVTRNGRHSLAKAAATHVAPEKRRVRLHVTPTTASWLNLVGVCFAIIERQALRRGDFASVEDLVAAIGRLCHSWNQRCRPFAWTKDANHIPAKLNRQNTSATDH